MALLHWYIFSIAWKLEFKLEVVKIFATFSNIVEYAITAIPRTKKDLYKLLKKIAGFLKEFESLYVADEPSKITQCRL